MQISNRQTGIVFDVKLSEKRKDTYYGTLSTYEGKELIDGEEKGRYSSWNVNFVGDAFKKAEALENGTKIILSNAKVENIYNKESKKGYTIVTVFKFEIAD